MKKKSFQIYKTTQFKTVTTACAQRWNEEVKIYLHRESNDTKDDD